MKTKLASLLGLACALVFFATGCETTAVTPVQALRTKAIINASKDKVWPLLVQEIGLEYPVRAIEKDSGLISADFVTLPAGFNNMAAARWIFPPGGFLATWNGLRMSLKILAVETEPGKTLVTINCHYEAFENNVQHAWIVAESNGAVENEILTKIEKQLPAPKQEVAAKTP